VKLPTTARAALVVACAVAFQNGCTLEGRSDSNQPSVILHTDTTSPDYGAVDVVNLGVPTLRALGRVSASPEQWHALLRVTIDDPRDSAALPLLGSHTIERDRLRFRPRFPPIPGQRYHVRFDGAAAQRLAGTTADPRIVTVDTTLLIHRTADAPVAIVEQIYPTAPLLPVNLLRIYVHFSTPMSRGEAYRRVHLLNEAGQVVEDAFLVVAGEAELWDPERRRLTLLFDPGRIKRGLRPHEEAGLPLHEGRTFRLVVDSVWQDARGRPLVRSFEKRFTVGPADRALPRTQDWQLTPPAPSGSTAVSLRFPESLDRALLERLLVVRRADGSAVPGTATISDRETHWRFTPTQPWMSGPHYIDVGTDLEDLAGNNLRDLFDVDRTKTQPPGASTQRVRIPFSVR
jgi:hypothetical protein